MCDTIIIHSEQFVAHDVGLSCDVSFISHAYHMICMLSKIAKKCTKLMMVPDISEDVCGLEGVETDNKLTVHITCTLLEYPARLSAKVHYTITKIAYLT